MIWYTLALAPLGILFGLLVATVRAYGIVYKSDHSKPVVPPLYVRLVALSYIVILIPAGWGAATRLADHDKPWFAIAYGGAATFSILVIVSVLLYIRKSIVQPTQRD